VVVVAAADRGDIREAEGVKLVPELESPRREDPPDTGPRLDGHLHGVEVARRQASAKIPGAANAGVAQVSIRVRLVVLQVIDRKEASLGVYCVGRALDRHALVADAMIDVLAREERARVARVGREFYAREQEEVRVARLRVAHERRGADGVVVADVHKVEPDGARKGGDLVERGGREGVAALARVHMEISREPCQRARHLEGRRGRVGPPLRLRRERRRIAQRDRDLVGARRHRNARLADHNAEIAASY
jgi:hypothetical protein